jgi:cobalt/nickel transport system permease protein
VTLFAVHISDGVLTPVAVGAGFAAAAALLVPAVLRVREEEVPRIGLLTAAFFVASSIHVKVLPAASVHLVLNALVGVVLGRRAPLAISVGMVLQALLLSHGGVTTLGVNVVVVSLPALGAAVLFRFLAGPAGSPGRRAFWAGAATGFLTVVVTAALSAAVLILGGVADWTLIAAPQFGVYLVLAAIEGVILGATADYLARVKPDLVGLRAAPTSSQSRTGA